MKHDENYHLLVLYIDRDIEQQQTQIAEWKTRKSEGASQMVDILNQQIARKIDRLDEMKKLMKPHWIAYTAIEEVKTKTVMHKLCS